MMTSAQVVKTSVTTTDNSPSQDYTHLDDQTTLLHKLVHHQRFWPYLLSRLKMYVYMVISGELLPCEMGYFHPSTTMSFFPGQKNTFENYIKVYSRRSRSPPLLLSIQN